MSVKSQHKKSNELFLINFHRTSRRPKAALANEQEQSITFRKEQLLVAFELQNLLIRKALCGPPSPASYGGRKMGKCMWIRDRTHENFNLKEIKPNLLSTQHEPSNFPSHPCPFASHLSSIFTTPTVQVNKTRAASGGCECKPLPVAAENQQNVRDPDFCSVPQGSWARVSPPEESGSHPKSVALSRAALGTHWKLCKAEIRRIATLY